MSELYYTAFVRILPYSIQRQIRKKLHNTIDMITIVTVEQTCVLPVSKAEIIDLMILEILVSTINRYEFCFDNKKIFPTFQSGF